MDIEQRTADGKLNVDWMLEDGMVVPVHLLYPGGEHERLWLEEVVAVGNDGGKPLFSWGFGPLTREGLSKNKIKRACSGPLGVTVQWLLDVTSQE